MQITTIIVTYNRKTLFLSCLAAVAGQTCKPNRIIIVDNASTDGTRELLESEGWLSRPDVELLALSENMGGAGGFSKGLKHAIEAGAEWVWMMDDDAEPHPDALAQLMLVATDPSNAYGSLAVSGNETSWPTNILSPSLGEVESANAVPERGEVQSLPFLGFLLHRSLVNRIGLPDVGFFIAADDLEYCARAQRAGAKIIVAGRSRIEHPKSRPYKFRLLGVTINCLALPAWKRYYDTRNRLLLMRKHDLPGMVTRTIPGTCIRFLASMFHEKNKLPQAHAFFAGFIDGVFGLKGKRHDRWGIK